MSEIPVYLTDGDRLLKEEEVRALTNLSPTTRWRKRKKGEFPPLIGGRANSLKQIQDWISEGRELAEAQAKAEIAKSSSPPRRGRRRKLPEIADTETHA